MPPPPATGSYAHDGYLVPKPDQIKNLTFASVRVITNWRASQRAWRTHRRSHF